MAGLLEVKHLSVSFLTPQGEVHALRDVGFSLKRGEILAVIGESGCGKSVLCKSILKLLPPSASIKSGSICMGGVDITGYRERDMCRLRGKVCSMVFQDPMTSLNPAMTVGAQIAEAVRVHQPGITKKKLHGRVAGLLRLTGIAQPQERSKLYPHQISGGMRQRIVLAMALASHPDILLADEPTTALDVTIQAQILDLLSDIRNKLGTAMVFVTHDLGAAARVADRVAVMYAGKIVEIGTAGEIFQDPRHPYTWGLLQALPTLSKGKNGKDALTPVPGMPPDPLHLPAGDAFACRNVYALGIDYEQEPPVFWASDTHAAATWLLDRRAPKITPPVGRVWESADGGLAQWQWQPVGKEREVVSGGLAQAGHRAKTGEGMVPDGRLVQGQQFLVEERKPACNGKQNIPVFCRKTKKAAVACQWLFYLGKKALAFLFSMFILATVVFYIARLAPGDPLAAYYGERAEKMGSKERALAEEKLGLHDPVTVQYARWLAHAVHGDFGISYKYKTDVLEVIQSRIGNTMLLGGMGFVLIFTLALLLGALCAWKEGSLPDRLMGKIGTVTGCIPEFWLSLVLMLIFAVHLKWLPGSGAYPVGEGDSISGRIRHLILPLTAVLSGHLWYYAYIVRNKLLEEMRADYVLPAKAKGLKKRSVFCHCLRNALPAYLSLMAVSVPHILGGTYIIETVFSYPGLGTLAYESARYQDYNLLMLLCILSGSVTVLCSMAAQAANERLDPRTKARG